MFEIDHVDAVSGLGKGRVGCQNPGEYVQYCRPAGVSTHNMAADLTDHKSFLVSLFL